MFGFGKPSAKKDQLTITPCSLNSSGDYDPDKSRSFKFVLNPSEFDHSYEISYNKKEAIGQSGSDAAFGSTKPEKLKVAVQVDGTGAVTQSGADPVDVKDQIQAIRDIVYKYDGDKHEPSYVQVLWGSQIFYGRLENMSQDTTLFKPNGEPLRAKLRFEFTSSISKELEARKANRSSPDMSHLIEVKAGDTLPLLCYRIYRDSSYYLEVARINNMTDFRDIKPGSKLHFPPLR